MTMNRHFFIIGAQRCGTTLLYRALDENPYIEMARPIKPEPKYFLNQSSSASEIDSYRSLYFKNTEKEVLCGEKSTSYIESRSAAENIRSVIPKAKIITLLRNPIERAISNYRFSVDNGVEQRDINDAFLNEEKYVSEYSKSNISVCPYTYLQRGRYVNFLKEYLSVFTHDQMMVIVLEDLLLNPGVYESLLSFLGVPPNQPNFGKPINSSISMIDELSDKTTNKLNTYFAETNKELSSLFNLDISSWKNSVPH